MGSLIGLFVGFILPIGLMIIVFYFLLIKPQNKERARVTQLIENLKKGDKIITVSGIVAEVEMINNADDTIIIKSEGSQLKVKKNAITGKLNEDEEVSNS